MNPRALVCTAFLAVLPGACSPTCGFADDSAASIAAGGLVPRRETRIVMAKEVLRISPTKIVVDYDFRNDTDEDVTTEVAFPIPPYGYGPDSPEISDASFSGFKLFVDGKPVAYRTEAKATLKSKDVTAILTADRIDIASFGHLREGQGPNHVWHVHTADVERLPKTEQQHLAKLGLFDAVDGWGMWDAHVQYHWTQTFPARSTVHIRHEYAPVRGFNPVDLGVVDGLLAHLTKGREIQKDDIEGAKLLESFCTDRPFLSALSKYLRENQSTAKTDSDEQMAGVVYPEWVDFILTSANTWKQPIEDFTLIVERGKPDPNQYQTRLVSFCPPQNTPVEKLDADHFQVHLTNFVPTSELRIGFFDLPDAKSPGH